MSPSPIGNFHSSCTLVYMCPWAYNNLFIALYTILRFIIWFHNKVHIRFTERGGIMVLKCWLWVIDESLGYHLSDKSHYWFNYKGLFSAVEDIQVVSSCSRLQLKMFCYASHGRRYFKLEKNVRLLLYRPHYNNIFFCHLLRNISLIF